MKTETIRDFYNRKIGFIETQPNGDKIVRDYYRRILGRYDKKHNVTRDFYNRIVGKGDLSGMLLSNIKRQLININQSFIIVYKNIK